jgi:hypothetical protein
MNQRADNVFSSRNSGTPVRTRVHRKNSLNHALDCVRTNDEKRRVVLPLLLRLDCFASLRPKSCSDPKETSHQRNAMAARQRARFPLVQLASPLSYTHTHTHTDTHRFRYAFFFPAERSTDTKQQPRQVKVRGVDLQVIYIYSN